MIAYNKDWLDNLFVRNEADAALDDEYISKTELDQVYAAYTVGFYSPNFFVRIGLFVLTVIIVAFTVGFFSLFMLDHLDSAGGFFIVFGLIIYGALEGMVRKRHYKSGVDDALLWLAAGNVIGGLNGAINLSMLANALIVLMFSAFLSVRFCNAVMAAIAGIALLAVVFFGLSKFGPMAKAIAPFVIMSVAWLLYFFTQRMLKSPDSKYHRQGLQWLSVTALICLYAAGNYYVVREASVAMFDLVLNDGQDIPFGWLFWFFTLVIPFVYITRGIQKKDVFLLRTGILLVAVLIVTVRYYYHLLPIETAMVLGGVFLIALAYALTKYLQVPKHGFTYKEQKEGFHIDKLQVESLVIAQTFSGPVAPVDAGTHFGGGSGTGGGASAEF